MPQPLMPQHQTTFRTPQPPRHAIPPPFPWTALVPPRSKYFNGAVQGLTDNVVSATVQLYNAIRAELLPTPSRSHYTFNLRDLSKVVQGVMRADPRTTSDPKQVRAHRLYCCTAHCMCHAFAGMELRLQDDDP